MLATHTVGDPLFWWYLGLGIGFAVVSIVVVVVATILSLASRIGEQAAEGIEGLDDAREETLSLWKLRDTNTSARKILEASRAARRELTEG